MIWSFLIKKHEKPRCRNYCSGIGDVSKNFTLIDRKLLLDPLNDFFQRLSPRPFGNFLWRPNMQKTNNTIVRLEPKQFFGFVKISDAARAEVATHTVGMCR